MNLLVVLQDYIRMLEPAYRDPTDEERSEYSEIMDDSAGATVPAELAGRVSTRTLVLVGGASPAWTIDIGRQVADALPKGQHRVLEDQEHVVPPGVLVPVLAEFFAGRNQPL
jgi:hypothetical protein